MSDSVWPHRQQPTRLLRPWDFQARVLEWVAIAFSDLLFDHFQFALIHGPDIPGSYAILLFTALDLTSITRHIHNWVLFSLWLSLFILSGAISPLFCSSILGTYQPEEFICQCHIFWPSQIHGVLKARILKWFAMLFSSGPCFVRTLCHDPSFWVALHGMIIVSLS